jgi:hypothetical protein
MENKPSAPNYYDLSKTKRNTYYSMQDKQYIGFLDEKLDKIIKTETTDSSSLNSLFASENELSGNVPTKTNFRPGIYL